MCVKVKIEGLTVVEVKDQLLPKIMKYGVFKVSFLKIYLIAIIVFK
jgi:hypothetical protein